MSEDAGWPTWKCAALTGALCSVPLALPFLAFPLVTFAAWLILLAVYLALVKIFGPGFVVAGGVIVLSPRVCFFLFPRKFSLPPKVSTIPSAKASTSGGLRPWRFRRTSTCTLHSRPCTSPSANRSSSTTSAPRSSRSRTRATLPRALEVSRARRCITKD